MGESAPDILEATIDDIQQAYKSGQLTCRGLVQFYLDRIAAYDKHGPTLNSIITLNGGRSTKRPSSTASTTPRVRWVRCTASR